MAHVAAKVTPKAAAYISPMIAHPWIQPTAAERARVATRGASALVRDLATVPAHRLGPWASAWPSLLKALPGLLKSHGKRVLDAVSRVDVFSALRDLAAGNIGRLRYEGAPVEAERLERALLTLWLSLAGHPGLDRPLALPGPFRVRVVDPRAPRLLAFGDVRAVAATDKGLIVLAPSGQVSLQSRVVASLPLVRGIVVVGEDLTVPPPQAVEEVRAALAALGDDVPALERLRLGSGPAACGEARSGTAICAAEIVATAQAGFVRMVLSLDSGVESLGCLIRQGARLSAAESLARICGEVVALPWRSDSSGARAALRRDVDDLDTVARYAAEAESLVAALRDYVGSQGGRARPRALLVNVDADDFVYSFQFGQSIERRCAERRLEVDRIVIDPCNNRDLAGEMGPCDLAPRVDGTEVVLASERDAMVAEVLPRLATRAYDLVILNVRPRLFYDLLEAGLLRVPTLVWDRHLHDGLKEEHQRRLAIAERVRERPPRIWSLQGGSGEELTRGNQNLFDAGLDQVKVRPWPLDLEYFQSSVPRQANLLFAGGDSGRDWPLFVEAVRDLPYAIHLVTRDKPEGLVANARVEGRLTLWRFRDALAAASVIAIPTRPGFGASGVTVLPMAMALGVAAVITRSSWVEQYVTDEREALLVEPGDVEAFRKALLRLHDEPGLREFLVANGKRRVREICDLDAFTREMFATLDEGA